MIICLAIFFRQTSVVMIVYVSNTIWRFLYDDMLNNNFDISTYNHHNWYARVVAWDTLSRRLWLKSCIVYNYDIHSVSWSGAVQIIVCSGVGIRIVLYKVIASIVYRLICIPLFQFYAWNSFFAGRNFSATLHLPSVLFWLVLGRNHAQNFTATSKKLSKN